MSKIWLVARREFLQRVRSRGFILSMIATPLMLIVISFFAGVFSVGVGDGSGMDSAIISTGGPVAYVDQADFVRQVPDGLADQVVAYSDTDAAGAALADGTLDAYYVIPPNYRTSGEVQRISRQVSLAETDQNVIDELLSANILPDADAAEVRRLRNPFGGGLAFVNVTAESDAVEETDDFSMLPLIVTMAIMLPLFASGGYLLQGLAQEKSNRVMEMLLLSVRPRQLLLGKLFGLAALTLVQYLVWILLGGLVLGPLVIQPGGGYAQIQRGVQYDPVELALVVPFALGGYLIYASLMAGIGALSPDLENSRGWVFVVSLPIMIPIYLWSVIVNLPDSALAVALSLIPFSAPVAMLMRMTATYVPLWQTGLSLVLLFATALGTIWLMARLFHAQTLLSGEAFSLRRAWEAVRAG